MDEPSRRHNVIGVRRRWDRFFWQRTDVDRTVGRESCANARPFNTAPDRQKALEWKLRRPTQCTTKARGSVLFIARQIPRYGGSSRIAFPIGRQRCFARSLPTGCRFFSAPYLAGRRIWQGFLADTNGPGRIVSL